MCYFFIYFLSCFSLSHLQTRRSHGLPGWGHTTGTSATGNGRQRVWYTVSWWVKGALSDFCQMMLVFESTKTNTPIAQHDLAPILISPPHTYVRNHCRTTITETHKHIQTKVNKDKLCETKQNQCYSPIKKKQHDLGLRFEPFALLEFSPPLESCFDSTLPDRNPSF